MLSTVWSIKHFPDINEKASCLFLQAQNQGHRSTVVGVHLDCALFSISVHTDLKKRERTAPKVISNFLKTQFHELLLKFFGHKNHSFCNSPSTPRPSPSQHGFVRLISGRFTGGWLSLPWQSPAVGTAPASLLSLYAENLLPKRNILPVPCTRFSKNWHRTTLIKMKILSRRHYQTKSVLGLTACSLLASTAYKIITVRIWVQEETSYSA